MAFNFFNKKKEKELTIEQKVKQMNEYNKTNFKYVEGRCYDDKMSVSGCVLKPGLGAGYHGVLFDYFEKYCSQNIEKMAIIAESNEAAADLEKKYPYLRVDNIVGYTDKKNGSDFDVDLNIDQNFKAEYDVLLSQALLEHVCNPFCAIKNFSDLLNENGIMLLHTHNIKMPYHAYPIDCIRYYEDFFVNITKYLPLEKIEYLEADVHIFCVYRKKGKL